MFSIPSPTLANFLSLAAIIVLAGCSDQEAYLAPEGATFELLSPQQSGVDFANTVTDGEDFNVLSYRNFYNGGGVAIADVNGDQLPDLYFTANQGPNKLFLNQGNLRFQEVEAAGGAGGEMGWSTGVTAVDVNADGLMDLYVCNGGLEDDNQRRNELFINKGVNENGMPQFEEMAEAYGLDDNGFGTQAAWLDYDRDGDLDVYLLNNSYVSPDRINPNGQNRNVRDPEGGDKLLRNDSSDTGHPVFTDVSEEAGIYGSRIGFGLGSGLGDIDGNGCPDIYVSNDFWERDYLYLNQCDGTFKEVLKERIDHLSISSMGSDVADLDNDGDPEIFSTDMLAADNQRLKASTLFDNFTTEGIKYQKDYHHQILQNCLQLNDGNGNFREIAHYSGVAATDWSWGALIFDFDLDGKKDIFVANGIYHDIMDLDFADFISDKDKVRALVEEKGRYDWRDFVEFLPPNEQVNYAFRQGKNLQFSNEAEALGLGQGSFSNGAAYGDLDGDGDLELVVNNVNQSAFIYANRSVENGGEAIRVRLIGPEHNPSGVGAKVTVMTDSSQQVQEMFPSRGYLSSSGQELIFGLSDQGVPQWVSVVWPDGKQTDLKTPKAGELLEINYADSYPPSQKMNQYVGGSYFAAAEDRLNQAAVHRDEFFNDFDHEILLHRQLSNPGPKVVKGDPNGDGLEDFLLLGSAGDPDKLYLQSQNGKFNFVDNSSFGNTAEFESSCGAFFDADGDGDEDLMLGSGGNEFSRGFKAYAVRYYENVNGNLVYNQTQAPLAGGEISCILPEDIDLDGDIDLFIGGRAVPNNYGLVPQSFLFIRENGQWVNQTPPSLGPVGMVTDGVWTDLNTDGRPDLVLVGDWMPITVAFTLNNATISDLFAIPNTEGWWTGISAADLDGDGKEDLVATNWGQNTTFEASRNRPLSMYTKDFDDNGKTEFIINWYPPADDKPYPFAAKRDIHKQLPHLRKTTLKYNDYADKQYETLFTPEEREKAVPFRTVELRSCVVWNEGKGEVSLEPLPWPAQLTTQFAAACGDVNDDGRTDLWLGGNLFGLPPQVGRSDAGRGTLLINKGNRDWEAISPEVAGISIRGEVRDAQFIQMADGKQGLLVGCHNDEMLFFENQEAFSNAGK